MKNKKIKVVKEKKTSNLKITNEILVEHHYSAWDHFLNRLVFIIYPSIRNKYSKSKLSMWGKLYDLMLFLAVISSLSSLAINTSTLGDDRNELFFFIEVIPFVIFTIDFVLKWICSKHYYKATKRMYFLFPLTLQGLYLTISLIPSFSMIFLIAGNQSLFDIFNGLTFFRIIRIFDLFLASKSFFLITNSVRSCWRQIVLFMMTIALLTFSLALIFYQVEKSNVGAANPVNITNFWEALYYTFIIMTTVGLGDKLPQTPIGDVTTVISALFGIMLYSVPSGMFTASMMVELRELKKQGSQEAYIYYVTSSGHNVDSKFKAKIRKMYGMHEK